MPKTNNLQDIFLSQARRERRSVTMFLMNGFQMRGFITGFDSFVVVLTTIVPERPVPLCGPEGEE